MHAVLQNKVKQYRFSVLHLKVLGKNAKM